MKIINIVLTILMVLLSITAGAAKVMQVPQEVEFLTSHGLSNTMIYLFGGVQILGAILLAIPKTKTVGASLTFIGFLVSSILVFKSGDYGFATISLLPVIIVGFLLYQQLSKPARNLDGSQ